MAVRSVVFLLSYALLCRPYPYVDATTHLVGTRAGRYASRYRNTLPTICISPGKAKPPLSFATKARSRIKVLRWNKHGVWL
ncbi:hypothetical protein YP_pCD10 (plasmid) [Yersinia pestis biovar Microtus str. 91001]|uniref:Uncharacterized protein n=1 Tax=Yersinia pestis TaxID=632 RepID=A0A0H2W045_YERPE|nr:hypothetical protein YP_pCD10 [Yersinia pestis biovar Microtus str. 91001]